MNKIERLEDLENFLISPVNIYWLKKSGKQVCVLPVGGVVDLSSLKKYPEVKIESFFDVALYENFLQLFQEFKNAHFEKERIETYSKFVSLISSDYWYGKNDVSLLPMVMACIDTFFDKGNSFPVNLKFKSEIIFQRSLLLGTMNVVYSILIGHLSYSFMKEAFNLALYYEHELVTNHLNTNFIQELEAGIAGKYPAEFVEKVVRDKVIDVFSFPFFSTLLKKHYEKIDGSGATGINGDEMNDTERLYCSLHHSLKIRTPSYDYDDGRGYLMGLVGHMKLDKKLELTIYSNFNLHTAIGA